MSVKKYKGLDAKGNVVRWISDMCVDDTIELWKQDTRVVMITENGKRIWKR